MPSTLPLDVPWDDYPMLASDDPVKTDLELTHTRCGERLCDAEADDTLLMLIEMVADHEATCHQTNARQDHGQDVP
ncbi:hypothetical protein ACFYPK_32720 [Streptomyces halstedii]|uniref:hypothetical protein n=1 Tax=Streptomyces halstedii TaxID=1944 RepID=UPI003460622B